MAQENNGNQRVAIQERLAVLEQVVKDQAKDIAAINLQVMGNIPTTLRAMQESTSKVNDRTYELENRFSEKLNAQLLRLESKMDSMGRKMAYYGGIAATVVAAASILGNFVRIK